MRTPNPLARLVLAAFAAALAAAPAGAQEDAPFQVAVGESKPLGGAAARCDDLAVVSVTVGPEAVITGLKAGTTTCSVAVGSAAGARRVIQVMVVRPPPAPGEKSPAKAKEQRGDRRPDGG